MDILKRKSKKRKAGTKPTVEQEIRKIDLKTKKLAHKFLVEEAKVNPAVKLQLIEREFGIKIPERDPLKEAKERIHETIIDEAVYTIEHNPKLVEKLSQGLIKNYAADLGIQTSDAQGTPFEKTLKMMEQYHKIQEGLGFGDNKSVWDTFKNPQVIVELLGLASQVVSMIRSDQKPSELIYVVKVDGKDIEMNEDEYTAYKQAGTVAISSKDSHNEGALAEAAPKEIKSHNDQPGDGIQVLVCYTH